MPVPPYSGTNLLLYSCTGIYSGPATSQLCSSPVLAPDVFELLCLVIRCVQHVAVWNWAPTLISGPSPGRLQSLARGEAAWQKATGWGLGQHVCRLARKASSGQRAGVRVETLYAKVSTRTGVRGRLCVGRRIGCWQQTPRTRIHGNGGTMAVAKS